MNPQQAENLRVLIRHMENVCARTLEMSVIANDCGTPACAMGEAAAIGIAGFSFSGGLRRGGREACLSVASDVMFGIGPAGRWVENKQAHRLFCGPSDNAWRRNNVTPKEWAVEARKVLAEHGYSMESDAFPAFMAKVMQPVAVEA